MGSLLEGIGAAVLITLFTVAGLVVLFQIAVKVMSVVVPVLLIAAALSFIFGRDS